MVTARSQFGEASSQSGLPSRGEWSRFGGAAAEALSLGFPSWRGLGRVRGRPALPVATTGECGRQASRGAPPSAPPRTAGQGTPGRGAQPAAPPLGAPPQSPAPLRWPPGARRRTRPGSTDTRAAGRVVSPPGSPGGQRAGQSCVHGPVSEWPVAVSLGTQPRTRGGSQPEP
ncbi:hypothetical protein ACRRTK_018229 [Alexandromys fortis]